MIEKVLRFFGPPPGGDPETNLRLAIIASNAAVFWVEARRLPAGAAELGSVWIVEGAFALGATFLFTLGDPSKEIAPAANQAAEA